MSNSVPLRVLELMSSRICHDLISPISAINNGLELFEELGPDAGDEVTDLISFSARSSAAKLQLMRFAYGAGGNDPSLRPGEVFKAFEHFVEGDRKIELDVPSPDRQMPLMGQPSINRILACTLLFSHECMPRGGSIEITCSEDTLTLSLSAVDENLWAKSKSKLLLETLSTEADELDPKTIHPYVTGLFLRTYGYDPELDISGSEAFITIKMPGIE